MACESGLDSCLQIEVRVFGRVGAVRGRGTGNGVCVGVGRRIGKDTGNGVWGLVSGWGVQDTGNGVSARRRDRLLQNTGNGVWVVTISSRSVRDGVPESRCFSSCRGDGTGNGVWGVTGCRSGVVVNGITCSGSRGGVSGR